MSESLFERAYRRHQERYLVRALFIQQQLLYVVIVLVVAGLSAYVDMSLGEFLRLALLACAFQFLYSLLSLPLEHRLTEPVAKWLRGDRSGDATAAAWRAAAGLPWELIRQGFTRFPLNLVWSFYLLWSLYLTWELDLPIYYAVLMYLGAVVLLLYATTLRYFSAERIARSVLRDIAAALPDGTAPAAPGPRVRVRLLAALPAINVITAVSADALTRGGDADLTDLVIVVLIATAVAATLSLVLTVLLSDSISEPLRELQVAARELGAGVFSTRVPVVTTDETAATLRSASRSATNSTTASERQSWRSQKRRGCRRSRPTAQTATAPGSPS